MERKTYLKLAALFLLIIYTVGRIGLVSEIYSAQFQGLTWLNLVITAVLAFSFHQHFTKRFILICLGVFASGFIIEWIGVRTGAIFGAYKYGETLGLKLDNIPLLIGLNWLVLIYAVANFLKYFPLKTPLYILCGSALMVLLDFFMEPFAVRFDLWSWNNNAVPLQNYVGWFVTSGIMLWFMRYAQNALPVNHFAAFVYFLQLIIFASFLFP
ncbi:MAG: carotenoid biosynthesis protein [Bacteroidia bacterium]